MPDAPLPFYIDDVVRLRKPHPCGGHDWTVVRLGADIGLRCHGCNHKVLLPRRVLEKRLKAFLSRGPGYAESITSTGDDEGAQATPSPGGASTPA